MYISYKFPATYDVAARKLSVAEDTSDLETQDEGQDQGHVGARKKRYMVQTRPF